MEEASFFEAHAGAAAVAEGSQPTYLQQWRDEVARIEGKVPDLPFSSIWVARESAGMVPEGSVVHFGILNSLRAWNLAPTPANCKGFCNTGGLGIDGCVSSLIGSSLALPDALHFGIVGDLAFFYDLNSLGNRHIGSNLRVMLVNNGCGTEFKMYSHTAFQFGEEADGFMAAAGHYGARSRDLVKGYATALGFEYLSAAGKDDFALSLAAVLRSGAGGEADGARDLHRSGRRELGAAEDALAGKPCERRHQERRQRNLRRVGGGSP